MVPHTIVQLTQRPSGAARNDRNVKDGDGRHEHGGGPVSRTLMGALDPYGDVHGEASDSSSLRTPCSSMSIHTTCSWPGVVHTRSHRPQKSEEMTEVM
ncbi:hypothetical protein HBH60_164400 [Parastagonospora nodorum]|nr:hypothetical protein HBI01_178300 [Parastagonospora nodorum]KAH4824110.1 hypothetical protein HBH60_164400 [Parastagonospora nodorum]KAH5487720.1 hypothetical protein HBI31_145570 [Parastagonospora nodorum]